MASWAENKRICTGDYREHADLEFGALVSKQSVVPRLPVPELAPTLELWLKSLKPLATPEEMEQARFAVSEFLAPGGIGEVLQKRLKNRAADFPDSSWLQLWWNQLGYLQPRDPLVININYFFQFSDDPFLPAATSSVHCRELGLQSIAAARLLTGILDTRDQLNSGTFPPEMFGASPACSAQWKHVFNACRVPKYEQDEVHLYNPNAAGSNNLLVLRNNKYYTVPTRAPNGDRYSTTDLAAMLQWCITNAGSVPDLNVGILTADDRDKWASTRIQLLADDVRNADSFESLQCCILALCLDDAAPASREDVARLLWHGAHSSRNNRWFDKSLQLIVFNNGKSGIQGEHSLFDGSPTVALVGPVLNSVYKKPLNISITSSRNGTTLPTPTQLKFIVSAATARAIQDSSVRFDDFIGLHDMRVLTFRAFGSQGIKK